MTILELNRYYLLAGEIENEEEKIKKIEAKLCASPLFDNNGVPKNPSPGNRTEQMYIELITRKEELERRVASYKETKASIENYIDNIRDRLIRRIAEERFYKSKSWKDVAEAVGGKNTEDSVKKMLYRYVADRPK